MEVEVIDKEKVKALYCMGPAMSVGIDLAVPDHDKQYLSQWKIEKSLIILDDPWDDPWEDVSAKMGENIKWGVAAELPTQSSGSYVSHHKVYNIDWYKTIAADMKAYQAAAINKHFEQQYLNNQYSSPPPADPYRHVDWTKPTWHCTSDCVSTNTIPRMPSIKNLTLYGPVQRRVTFDELTQLIAPRITEPLTPCEPCTTLPPFTELLSPTKSASASLP